MKEVLLYKKLKGELTECNTCAHFCKIAPEKRGICNVRENIDGKLYALNYGKVVALNIDPIEKKPLFHFLPGTYSLSFACVGCNLRCLNCQNYDISQGFKQKKEIPGQEMSPKEIVQLAIKNKLPSISYTYTEPTIFLEFAFDTMKLAKKAGLKNIFVSNGFMSEESAKLVIPYLDANNIDIKGFSEEFYKENCGARLQPILDTCKLMKKSGVWVEITTLAIPTLSDSEEMFEGIAKFIYKELGPETPWHISRFSGEISWKLQYLPETPVETIEKGWKIGKKVGLKYVYTGNIPGLPSENTICPKCGTIAIDRVNYIIHHHDKSGKCPKCGTDLNIISK
jgi:pyruvate formate lyase activating enzyme